MGKCSTPVTLDLFPGLTKVSVLDMWNKREMLNLVTINGFLRRLSVAEIYSENPLLEYHQDFVRNTLRLSKASTFLVFGTLTFLFCEGIYGEKTYVTLPDGTKVRRLEYMRRLC